MTTSPAHDTTSIGDILWRTLGITRAQLRAAVEAQRSAPDEKLGRILVGAGHITENELHEALALQKGLRSKSAAERLKANDRIVEIAEKAHERAQAALVRA